MREVRCSVRASNERLCQMCEGQAAGGMCEGQQAVGGMCEGQQAAGGMCEGQQAVVGWLAAGGWNAWTDGAV